MIRLVALLMATILMASAVHAQPKKMERNVEKQRAAVEAWTACIADEFPEDVTAFLSADYRSKGYQRMASDLTERRVSEECFNAMPRAYRRIQLGGLPFAGGLAERMMEQNEEPLIKRLSMAAIGPEAVTFSYTDKIASCITRGAPHLVAKLFGTDISSEDELAALAELGPVKNICTSQSAPVEASPLAMRSMLATASFRILAAQAEQPMSSEAMFVECLAEKQPDLIVSIRDAESQEGFEAAMKAALEVCPLEDPKMSMGKLFRELAKHKADDAGEAK